jgi:hypothetical protein
MPVKSVSRSLAVVEKSIMIVVLLSSLLSCDESLPPREQPSVFLNATLRMSDQTFVIRYQPPGGQPAGIFVQVENIFDEVLQDSLYVRGTVEIRDMKRPGLLWRQDLRRSEIVPQTVVSGKLLTLLPHESIGLKNTWSHLFVDQNGITQDAWTGVDTTVHISPYNEVYYITDTLYLKARATVQVMKQAGNVESNEVGFRVVYWIFPPPVTDSLHFGARATGEITK